MLNPNHNLSPFLIFITLMLFVMVACRPPASSPTSAATTIPAPTASPEPALGDILIRPIDGATLVYVPAGTFTMGIDYEEARAVQAMCKKYSGANAISVCQPGSFTNEQPAHAVSLAGFWLDQTEVTNGRYRQCAAAGACTLPAELGSNSRESYYPDPAFANYPVVWITRDQAAEYCAWVGGRLPTEAEWEYAARGPESLTFPWGNEFDGSRLNYCDVNCPVGLADPEYDDGYADTAPVGSYPGGASWVGALDLAGNVREWVADWFSYYPADAQSNPTGPVEGQSRIPRGGSWLDIPADARSSNRGENEPNYTRHKVGFRCAHDAAAG